MYMYVYAHICRCPVRSEEDIRCYLSGGVTAVVSRPAWVLGTKPLLGPLEEQQATADHPFHTHLFEKVSHCSLAWSWTHHVAQPGFQFELVFLPQPSALWDYRCIYHYAKSHITQDDFRLLCMCSRVVLIWFSCFHLLCAVCYHNSQAQRGHFESWHDMPRARWWCGVVSYVWVFVSYSVYLLNYLF